MFKTALTYQREERQYKLICKLPFLTYTARQGIVNYHPTLLTMGLSLSTYPAGSYRLLAGC